MQQQQQQQLPPHRSYPMQQQPPPPQEQKQQPPLMSRTQHMQCKAQSAPTRSSGRQPQQQQQPPLYAPPGPSPFFGTFFPAGASPAYMHSPPMLPPAVAPAGGFVSAPAMQAYLMRLSQQISQQQQQLGWMQQPQFAAGGGGLPLVNMPPLLPPAVMFPTANGPPHTERTHAPSDFSLTDKLPYFSPDRSSNGNATARGSAQSKPRRRKTEQMHPTTTPPLLPAAFHPAYHATPHQLQQQEKQQLSVRSPGLSPRASGRPSTLAALPTFVLLDAILQTPEFSGQQLSATSSPPSKSRKTLSSHANMRVAYSGSGSAAARAARRASDIASESLAAGLPVQIVSSLREAGLVSTLFSPTGNTDARRSSMANDGSDRAFPWNMTADSQQQQNGGDKLNRLPSLQRNASTADAGANAAASPAPTAGTSVTATPAESGAASSKSGVSSPKSSNGAASVGSSPSKPAVATLQLPAAAGSPGATRKDANSKRRLSFMVTPPDNNVRTPTEDDAGLADVQRLASALAAMEHSPGGSIDASAAVSPDGSVAGTTAPSAAGSAAGSAAVSAAVSPTASVVPSTVASRAASPTAEARRLVLRPSRDGPGLPPDGTEEHQSGVIYITREVSSSKKRVTLLNPAITAAEKAEKAAKEKERLRRYAERDQKKREAEEEKKYRQAEAEAAAESRAAARERMKNHLAEQGIQRQKEKEAREKAEREAALAAERAAAEEEKSNPSKPRPGVPSFLARIARTKQDAAETEARTKLRQELNPEIEEGTEEDDAAAAEAEDGEQVVPLGTHKRSKKGSDGGMEGDVTTDRESRRMSRLPTSARIMMLADPKRANASTSVAKKKPLLLVSLRMINAAKRGDVDELRKILSEEFGSGANKSSDKNKSGETRAEFLNRPDKNGSSALFHAVWPGHEEFMALLLEEGASANYQNTRRNTVMHLAVERGHDSIVRLLLRHGANPLISNNNNHASFQVLPNTREQLQWASFLYITLEAIWKKANPNWAPDEEASATATATDGATAVGNSPAPTGAVTSPADTVSPDASKPAADGDSDATKSSAIDVGSDEMHVLDDSQDHSVLSALSPNTPMWLNELYQIFQRKDTSRTHTKHLQTKVLGIMRMTTGFRGIAAVAAAAAAKSKHAAANKEAANKEALVNSGGSRDVTFDSAAAPGPRGSLTSSSGGGLANLLKQMKRSSKKSTKKTGSIDSTASTGSGKDGAGTGGSGKNSARGSLEVHNSQPSSSPNTGRRGSTEFTQGGATAASGSSRRSHHVKGASGSPPLSSRSSATAPVIVMPNASTSSNSSTTKTRDRVGSPTAGHRAMSPTPATTAVGTAATSGSSPAAAAASAAAPASTASPDPPAPTPTPVSVVLFPSASTVPAPTAAKVKTFSIFSASLQDMDEPAANKRGSAEKQAGFSIWKKTFETAPTPTPTRR